MKAVLITGSREWTRREPIHQALLSEQMEQGEGYELMRAGADMLLIHGGCRGADSIAELFAQQSKWNVIPMPAQWEKHGKQAGILRNVEMVNMAEALRNCGWDVVVLAFPLPGSRGTRHCMDAAKARGLRVEEPNK